MLRAGILAALLASPIRAEVGCVEPGGARLQIVGGELVRHAEHGATTLRSIEPDALGRVIDVACDGAGTVFVVSDRGLWIGWDELDVLDRVTTIEDAPPGAPTSVHVDRERRVWIATDSAVGVVDPVFFAGRTLADVAARCGGGPYSVRAGRSGGPVFRGASGEVEIEPGAGVAPAIPSVRLRGVGLAHGDRVGARHGDRLELDVDGEAEGGAVVRHRLDGHHVWNRGDGGVVLERVPPGAHTLEIVVVDAFLRRSAPFAVELDVELPTRYQPRFVLAAGAATLLLLGALFARRYRGLDPRARCTRTALSSAVAATLALQLLAGAAGHAAGWPFVGYTMYTTPYAEGSCTYEMTVVGTGANGVRRPLTHHELGAVGDDPWAACRALIDGGPRVARRHVGDWNLRHGEDRLAGIAVHSRRTRLTADGPVRVAPLVHCAWPPPPATPR